MTAAFHPAAARLAILFCALGASGARAAEVGLLVQDQAGGPIAGAVAYLDSADARAAVRPLADARIAQQGKRFVPEVSVVPVGTEVQFPNLDKVRHHVYSLSPIRPFELKLYAGAPANPVRFDQPGVAVLGCNIHDRMVAWVVVVETPHHALTAADGRLRLADVPPGSYTLRVWHPSLPVGDAAWQQALVLPAAGAQVVVRLPVVVGAGGS